MSKELSGLVMDMKSTDILVIIIYLKLPSAGLVRGYPVADFFYNASLPANRAEAELTDSMSTKLMSTSSSNTFSEYGDTFGTENGKVLKTTRPERG